MKKKMRECQDELRKQLASYLNEVKLKNRSLSLRSISQKISVNSGTLSAFIHGKRYLSLDNYIKVVNLIINDANKHLYNIATIVLPQKSNWEAKTDLEVKCESLKNQEYFDLFLKKEIQLEVQKKIEQLKGDLSMYEINVIVTKKKDPP